MIDKLKWLDIIEKKQGTLISERNWIWAQTNAYLLLSITFSGWLVEEANKQFFHHDFDAYGFCSFSTLFLLSFLTFRAFYEFCFNSSKDDFRLKDVLSIKRRTLPYVFIGLIIISLYSFVFIYTKKLLLTNYLLIPPIILYIIIFVTAVSHLFRSSLDLAKISSGFRKFVTHKRTIIPILWSTLAFPLIITAAKLHYYHGLNALMYIKLLGISVFLSFFAFKFVECLNINLDIPDLSELQFEILTERIKTEEEIIDKYETLLLGKKISSGRRIDP